MGRGRRGCLGHDGCEESRFGNRCHGDELLLPACEVGLPSRLRHRRGTAHPHLEVKRTLLSFVTDQELCVSLVHCFFI